MSYERKIRTSAQPSQSLQSLPNGDYAEPKSHYLKGRLTHKGRKTMARIALPLSLALGAMLAAGNAATAGENAQTKIGTSQGRTGTSMTLGGSGTAAKAAAAPDTEQVWWGYWRGYRRGFYNGLYAGPGWGWGGWGGYYYPTYAYPAVSFYPPIVGFGARVGPLGFGVGINGTGNDVAAPAVSLNLAQAPKPAAQPQTQPKAPQPPARYDGGPANPIPLPKEDAQPAPAPPQETGLPVSLPKKTTTQPAKPYAYKGYGEK
jgi:hypothetical protein